MATSKPRKKKKIVRDVQPPIPKTFRERWDRYSFSQKVMAVFSLFIVISMVLALFPLVAF